MIFYGILNRSLFSEYIFEEEFMSRGPMKVIFIVIGVLAVICLLVVLIASIVSPMGS